MSPDYAYLNDFIWGAGITLSLILCPLLPGVIARVKAFFAGRKGPRLLQLYFDLAKLLHRAGEAGWLGDDYCVPRMDCIPHHNHHADRFALGTNRDEREQTNGRLSYKIRLGRKHTTTHGRRSRRLLPELKTVS